MVRSSGWMLIAGLLLMLHAHAVIAATYVVDQAHSAASDDNPGSADKPFKTIKKAAAVVEAGDRVLVKAGIYPEFSIIMNKSGTADKPIVFEAETPYAVTISGGEHVKAYSLNEYPYLFGCPRRNAKNGELWDGAEYITLRGFIFQNGVGAAIGAGTGWHVEDCLIEGPNLDGLVLRGADIVIKRCVVQDVGNNGMAGIACTNLLVSDCIVRRSNRHGFAPGGFAGACKFLMNAKSRFENIVSYDNFGSGWWLDWDNHDYEIVGCTIFGNHAGKATENNQIVDHWWAAPGIWLEGNHGKGRIAGNVIYSNVCSGIGVLETQNVVIENNLIVDCGTGIEYRDLTRDKDIPPEKQLHRLNNITVRHNTFKAIRGMAHLSSIGDWTRGEKPGDYGLEIDANTYDLKPGNEVIHFLKTSAKTLDEARALSGIEKSGTTAAVDFKAALIPTVSTDEKEFYSTEKTRFRQVPSDEAEKISMDETLAKAHAGDVVTVAVFGRTPFHLTQAGGSCEVYDLARGRHIQLTLDAKSQAYIEKRITPYALLTPTELKLKLTRVEPYTVVAEPVVP